ncbi:hypothetical protein [Nonomuraea sp. NPDC023979]|uniref:hypothetical protein n=1 Tax=Nonomuraea sp. NPDC023979 TaxID=3154796 RepID=UPI0033F0AB7B
MRKIPTIFVRDWDGNPRYVTRQPDPECAWVFAGEGEATAKWDGVCIEHDDRGKWWARREVKHERNIPAGYRIVQHDPETGKLMGWEPIEQSGFARWHAEVLERGERFVPGTYELLGPKVNGNPDGFEAHVLMRHGWAPLFLREEAKRAPRDYDGLAAWLAQWPNEGVVWHHPDGRMAKIKRRDFPQPEAS